MLLYEEDLIPRKILTTKQNWYHASFSDELSLSPNLSLFISSQISVLGIFQQLFWHQIWHKIADCGTYKQRWSPRGRPWPRGHILKSLALASKPQVLGLEALGPRKLACPRLEDSAIIWTVEISLENSRNLAENLQIPFLFSATGA